MCKKDDKDCNSSGYKIEQKLGVESYVMDVNVNSRKTAFLSCMEKNGWKKTSWL
jgi:shikimate 5-dehydrogenase